MAELFTLRSQLSSDNSNQPALLLEFALRGDRFASRLRSDGSDNFWLESIEGIASETDNANWPRSSPLQEIVPQSDAEGDYLAGIGRAGKSHWSVIIRPLSDRLGFDFDFACRVKDEPIWLGSTYRNARESDPPQFSIETEDARVLLNQHEISISPKAQKPESLPATIRWRYQLVCNDNG